MSVRKRHFKQLGSAEVACKISPGFVYLIAFEWREVTCRNCLKHRPPRKIP